ncbi:RelB [Lentilactobacillus kefiri]|nr:RelB [Lentilactobacillus kefiri]PAK80858.1 RelB [Lentilactobacillus kefiri]PAL05274.1 RelB [Lentilactobacillus kefiri]QGV24214.1 RelB [Lentilactobacillus kefiri]
MIIPMKDKTISIRVSEQIADKAKRNLENAGITVSEYLRMALISAAENGVTDLLNSPEAMEAKYDTEHGKTKDIGTLEDYKKWSDSL